MQARNQVFSATEAAKVHCLSINKINMNSNKI